MQTPIQFLEINDFRVLKIIRIEGPEWNNFTGYFYYKRFFTKDYNSETNDLLDNLILKSIKELNPKSTLCVNKDVLFKGEFEDILKGYTGGTSIDLTIRFTPHIPFDRIYEIAGKELYEYFPKFKLNLFLSENNEKLKHINNFAISYVPFDEIDNFGKLLKTIDFLY